MRLWEFIEHIDLDYITKSVFDETQTPNDDELSAAKSLGLPLTYAGKDSRDKMSSFSVDNPLPRTKHIDHAGVKSVPEPAMSKHNRTAKTMKISDLKSAQDYIRPTTVQSSIDGIHHPENYLRPFKPVVAEINGEHVLIDGNHKTLAAKLAGNNTIDVHHIGKYDPLTRTNIKLGA